MATITTLIITIRIPVPSTDDARRTLETIKANLPTTPTLSISAQTTSHLDTTQETPE